MAWRVAVDYGSFFLLPFGDSLWLLALDAGVQSFACFADAPNASLPSNIECALITAQSPTIAGRLADRDSDLPQ